MARKARVPRPVKPGPRFANIAMIPDGFQGQDRGMDFRASYSLFLIREAWQRGADLEHHADGFGPGMGTMGGDWSGIRDSSPQAQTAMLEAALNHLFGRDDEGKDSG